MVYTKGFNPQTGEWNDSFTGDYMWSNTNIGETLSDVMTPFTWSMISASFEQMNVLPGYPVVGNIAGRAYNNGSVMVSALQALGKNVDDLNKEMGGLRADYVDDSPILMIPLPRASIFPILLRGIKFRWQEKMGKRHIPGMLAGNIDWCQRRRLEISQVENKADLAAIWANYIIPYSLDSFWMVVSSAWHYGELVGKLRGRLTDLVGLEDADKLLSNVSSDAELLASLGPIVGLAKVAKGEMSRQEYLDLWGHRGPHESEVSTPRPAEDPAWLDHQLTTLGHSLVEVEALLTGRQTEFDQAWARFAGRYPREAGDVQRQINQTAEAARVREAVRSELVRLIWVARDWTLKAGQLTGLDEGIFFLTTEEVEALLAGDQQHVTSIPARQATYKRYKELPPYPVVIRGRFDPFEWAADPQRRGDFFDAEGIIDQLDADMLQKDPSLRDVILGVPGSAGVTEGIVRLLEYPEDGHQLQPGEILVATQTNIGWTPLFPLAKAVVTDVGAALSHAAIVARELGIPAVVNCGNATTRLKTGDKVQVDGSQGKVTILDRDSK